MRIAIMKEASIYREVLLSVLSNEFNDYDVITVDPKQQDKLQDDLIDLLIVDIDTAADINSLIKHYIDNNKHVIIWTEDSTHPELTNLFKLDLQGYFYNGMEKEALIKAIKKILLGKQYIHEELAPNAIRRIPTITQSSAKAASRCVYQT
ncbi:hypothetical protein JCM21714_4448 [Gracilibacillus boraciitolerans JCM 21714]|uniref:Response regulatory domain-containing protein n=1 Tax=Gracilibacillus boraciitolerans JCM 21714 TaxID=1298598 RepID=W4VQN6_9BACI|nr:hypothetical protein [Gracilibacillus boraciitolerans]GAE95233.1 hypothetical protein JCM21714_4448 [Gracilibacillus boraciitolerans JCM 21714]